MHPSARRLVDQASSPRRELSLYEIEGSSFELTYDGLLLRASSDEITSRLAIETMLDLVGDRNQIDLLIGGLGFGGALARALEERDLRTVKVVEAENRIPEWGRTHFGLSDALDDPRTEMVVGAFEAFVRANPESYHGILIDVDRSPSRPVVDDSRRVYSLSTLDLLARHLRSDGVLAVCLDEEDKAYRRALAEVFSEVGSRPVVEDDAPRRMIYFGRP